MSVKGNTAIAIDREAINNYYFFARKLRDELERIRNDIAGPIMHLTDEGNISGGDAESFFESLNILKSSLEVIQKKMDTVTNFTSQLNSAYGMTAYDKKKTLKEAKEDMAKSLIKARQLGK